MFFRGTKTIEIICTECAKAQTFRASCYDEKLQGEKIQKFGYDNSNPTDQPLIGWFFWSNEQLITARDMNGKLIPIRIDEQGKQIFGQTFGLCPVHYLEKQKDLEDLTPSLLYVEYLKSLKLDNIADAYAKAIKALNND